MPPSLTGATGATSSTLTELDSADRYCRFLAARHYENFSVTSVVLPATVRLHLARIYAFCRTTDELGDETDVLVNRVPSRQTAKMASLQRLESWRQQLSEMFEGSVVPVHPVLIALRETVGAFDIPAMPFFHLIDANIQDQTVHEYQTWDQLEGYCKLSAASVGRMVLPVFRASDRLAEALSDDVCIGLQIANHAQDVTRDAKRGRSYLPIDEVRDLGIPGTIRDLTDRAERLLSSGRSLEGMVPFAFRTQLALYRLGGLEVIRAIRRLEYRTDLSRPRISTATKVALLGRALTESVATMRHATPKRAA